MQQYCHSFIAIDVENVFTDGHRHICQLGIAVVRDLQLVDTKVWNIQPPFNIYDDVTPGKHHMSPADTAAAPTLPEVWTEIADYLKGHQLWAHNAKSAEVPIISEDLDFYGIAHDPLCICDSRDFCQRTDTANNAGTTLQLSCLAYGIHFDSSKYHNAGYDAEMCASLVIAHAQGRLPDWNSVPATAEELRKAQQQKITLRMGDFQKWLNRVQNPADDTSLYDLFAEISSTRPDAPMQTVDIFDIGDAKPKEGVGAVDCDRLNTEPDNPLYGCKVAVTGSFYIRRAALKQAIEEMGAELTSSISKKTSLVLIGAKNVGLPKLAAIEKLYANGYQVPRVVGDDDLDTLLYADASVFNIGSGERKQLDLTWAHVQKFIWPLQIPVNSISGKEIYLPATIHGDRQMLAQVFGNLGAYANNELDADTQLILLPKVTINALQRGEKDELIREIEHFYNARAARTFSLRFLPIADFFTFIHTRLAASDDPATALLESNYEDSCWTPEEPSWQ